jgi:hypothetical protein
MNTAYTDFQQIIENIVFRYGRDVLWEKRFSNLLCDGINGAFHDQAELFLLALNSGLADRIRGLGNIRQNELVNIAECFSAEHCVRSN